jgi:hypothetical protein
MTHDDLKVGTLIQDKHTKEVYILGGGLNGTGWFLESSDHKRYGVSETTLMRAYDLYATQETVVNEYGGKISRVKYAFHLLPYEALLAVANCVKTGADKYDTPGEEPNWKKIPLPEHVNHSIGHAYLGLSGDTTEDHFVNAATRALFALQMHIESKGK